MKKYFIFLLLLLPAMVILAQKVDTVPLSTKKPADLTAADSLKRLATDTINPKKLRKPFRFKRNEFHFLIQTTILANASASAADSIPLYTVGSGTTTMAAGYNFNLSPKFAVHFQPGISYYKLSYRQIEAKNFPTSIDTFKSEKHRFNYLTVPLGLTYTIKRNEQKERKTYVELGGFVGYQFRSLYKVTYTETLADGYDHSISHRIQTVPYANRFRYGIYTRVGQGFFSLYASYRLSNVFLTKDSNDNIYPVRHIPRLEVGLGIAL